MLECTVISGCPNESLSWVHKGIKLLESTYGVAKYTISIMKQDHLSQYTCKAISPALKIPLSKTVTIEVHCEYSINYSLKSFSKKGTSIHQHNSYEMNKMRVKFQY